MVVCHSLDGQNVTDDQCQDLKPLDIQICDMGSCAQGWFHSPWSRKVSPSQHVVIYNPCDLQGNVGRLYIEIHACIQLYELVYN